MWLREREVPRKTPGFLLQETRVEGSATPWGGFQTVSSEDPMMRRCFYLGTGQGRVSRADDTPCLEHRASNCLA